jgi:16S rRNA (cytosine1402-N4)-methyltransferase
MYSHNPVLLNEVIDLLEPGPGQNFVDGTLGGGGYTQALLKRVLPKGKVLAIDMDEQALANAESRIRIRQLAEESRDNLILAHGNFADLDKILRNHEFTDIAGIVADIGLSSNLLDNSGRGFSFQTDEPLDMRFDLSSQGSDARFLLNSLAEAELVKTFRDYGEEKLASKIAWTIVKQREQKQFHTTGDLIEAIKIALPKPQQHRWTDTARRIFQALRIAVNHELQNLESFLPKAFDLLNPGGRMAIVTFHSLEDRIVKHFFLEAARGCICPLDFPICRCGKNPLAKILTKKPVIASEAEQESNSRSKSAKLRVIEKL